MNAISGDETYQSQYKGNCSYWKRIILGELRVYNTLILLILEPDLVDKGLYQSGTKYACFQCGILSIKILTVSSNTVETDKGSPYKGSGHLLIAVPLCHESPVLTHDCQSCMQI